MWNCFKAHDRNTMIIRENIQWVRHVTTFYLLYIYFRLHTVCANTLHGHRPTYFCATVCHLKCILSNWLNEDLDWDKSRISKLLYIDANKLRFAGICIGMKWIWWWAIRDEETKRKIYCLSSSGNIHLLVHIRCRCRTCLYEILKCGTRGDTGNTNGRTIKGGRGVQWLVV